MRLQEKLYRSREHRMIAGVAGGIAEYFEIDVTIVRLLWILGVLVGGGGVLVYIIAWIIIPEKEEGTTVSEDEEGEKKLAEKPSNGSASLQKRRNAGLLLIGVGLFFLLRRFVPWQFSRYLVPLLLVGLGLYLLLEARDK